MRLSERSKAGEHRYPGEPNQVRALRSACPAVLIAMCSLLTGCAANKPAASQPPAPPPPSPSPSPSVAAKPKTARPMKPGDILLKNCSVVKQSGDLVWCECHRPIQTIDKNRGDSIIDCR
jgi:hypothetical protein